MTHLSKFKKAVLLISILGVVMLSAAGCRSRHRSGPVYQAWYDVYGHNCGSGQPRPGCIFYWNGTKVVDSNDTYYYSSYNVQYDLWYYTDSYGYSSSYLGWAWLSYSGILYDDYGRALNEDADKDGVDVVTGAAQAAREVVLKQGKTFAERYGLAEEAGVKIATTLNDFAVIGKSRARTQQDIEDFTKRLYGVDFTEANAALEKAKAGDASGIDGLNGTVAAHWGTNPETSKEILKKWFKDQADEYNVK